mgnify:CR=1 FL=1
MEIEHALKLLFPHAVNFTSSGKGTSPEKVTASDIMMAFSLASAKAPLGVNLLLAKFVDKNKYKQEVTEHLLLFSQQHAPSALRKGAGEKFTKCSIILASFALDDCCSSAASCHICPVCTGTGSVDQLTHEDKPVKLSASVNCPACLGKGVVSSRCRCGGRGVMQDRKASRERGIPVFKECQRCKGKGYSLVKASTVYKAILQHLPELHIRSWNRNWKIFYDLLVSHCYREEENAKKIFREVTRF